MDKTRQHVSPLLFIFVLLYNFFKVKKKTIYFTILFSFLVLFFLDSFLFVLAQDRQLEVNYPEILGIKPTAKTGLPEYIKYLFNFAVITSGFILFSVFIYSGILFLLAGDNPTKISEARSWISGGILGVLILLSSWIILHTINPQLFTFQFPPIKIKLPKYEVKKCAKDEECPGFPDFACDISHGTCHLKGKTLLVYEIPLGTLTTKQLWSDKRIEEIKKLNEEFQNFLEEKIKVGDKEFRRISDLNQYLKTLTWECQCSNLDALATKSTINSPLAANPVACTGDPCPDKARKEIEEITKINLDRIKRLENFTKEFKKQINSLDKDVEKFSKGVEDAIDCMNNGEIYTLTEELALAQEYENRGWQVKILRYFLAAENDPFVFYCAVGGAAKESYHKAPSLAAEELIPAIKPEGIEETEKLTQPIYCPLEIPVGEILQQAMNLTTQTINTKNSINYWLEQYQKEIRDLIDLNSQCNNENCSITSGCLPNPCYEKCEPEPWNFCLPFCRPRCITAAQGCTGNCSAGLFNDVKKKIDDCLSKGDCLLEDLDKIAQGFSGTECKDACPRIEIEIKVAKIKLIEDEIFNFLREDKEILPQIEQVKSGGQETSVAAFNINVESVGKALKMCSGPITEKQEIPAWFLINCRYALGAYGPDKEIIAGCHPWNYFCCGATQSDADKLTAKAPSDLLKPRAATIEGEPPIEPIRSEFSRSGGYPVSSCSIQKEAQSKVACVYQADSKWATKRWGEPKCSSALTFQSSSCSISALTMAINYLRGTTYTPIDVHNTAVSKTGFTCGAGPSFPPLSEAYGLSYQGIPSYSKEKLSKSLKNCLNEGGLIWFQIKGDGKYTSHRHFMLITDISDDYVWATINDPGHCRYCWGNKEKLDYLITYRGDRNPPFVCLKKK